MPYIKLLVTLFTFLFLFAGFLHPITAMTQDLGRHLKTGEIIVRTQSVPKTNLYSYTYPDFLFINHHWLSEVVFYLLYQVGGFNLLLFATVFAVMLAYGLVYFFSLKQAGSVTLAFASLLYLSTLFERTDVRPEIFSFLFLSIFIVILYRYRERFTRWIFLLPLLELFWVNIHVYFIIGIAVLGLFLLDAFITKRKHLHSRYTGIFVVVFLVSVLTTLLNPNGIAGALYPFRIFANYGYTIEENQTVFFLWEYSQKPTILFFWGSVALLFTGLFATAKKGRVIDFLLAIFFTILAASAIRNFPLFVFATFIPFVREWSLIEKELSKKIVFIGLLCILGLFVWQTVDVVKQKPLGVGVVSGATLAADFFIKQNLKGPIFNNFDIGSYLGFRLYPKDLPAGRQGKVFVDGRPEAYPVSFFKQIYIPMQEDPAVFAKIDQKYNFNTIFFAHTDQTPWAEAFLQSIVKNSDWHIVYLDDTVVILSREKKATPILRVDEKDVQSLFRLARFYQITGEKEKEQAVYQKILSLDPFSCPVLYNLSVLLSSKDPLTSNAYQSQFSQRCR